MNSGCVPSKALIRCARAAAEQKRFAELGRAPASSTTDFAKVMERMREKRAAIAPVDSAATTAAVGADAYVGNAVFTGRNSVEVTAQDGTKTTLKFRKAVVATGGTAMVPPIPGLGDVPYHTNSTLFNLTAQPKRMVVVGGGPIGLEMAQAFSLLGTEVTVCEVMPKLLPREDPEAAAMMLESIRQAGVTFKVGVKISNIDHEPAAGDGFPTVRVHLEGEVLEAEVLLVATGRKPNVDGIGLEEAGVEFTRQGIEVSDLLQTTNPDIYAVGDVAWYKIAGQPQRYLFTHMAGRMAFHAVENALFDGQMKMSDLVVPWVTYTSPEVAHVGLYESDMEARGIACKNFQASLEHNDRAILEGDTEGFCKIHTEAETGKIRGATIVAEHAGEMISELTVAIQFGLTIYDLSQVIHPYPTVAECVGSAAHPARMAAWKRF